MTSEIRDERNESRYSVYLGGRRVWHAERALVRETVVLPHMRVEADARAVGVGPLL